MSFADQLYDVRKVHGQWGRNMVFQRGCKTYYCIPEWMSVDTPAEWSQRENSTNAEMTTASSTVQTFKWNEMKEFTLTNHSSLPVYVKVWHLRAKTDIPLSLIADLTRYAPITDRDGVDGYYSASIADGAGTANVADPSVDKFNAADGLSVKRQGYHSWVIGLLCAGWTSKYGSKMGTDYILQNDQYWSGAYTGALDVAQWGEGTGAANPNALAGYATHGFPFNNENNYTPCYGCSVPLSVSMMESDPIRELFRLDKCDKFVLGPSAPHVFYLSSKKIKYKHVPTQPDSGNIFIGTGPYDHTKFLANTSSKFIIIEVEGSSITSDVMTKGAKGLEIQVTTANVDATAAPNEPLLMEGALNNVTTHGGWLSLRSIYQYNTGASDVIVPEENYVDRDYAMNVVGAFFHPMNIDSLSIL